MFDDIRGVLGRKWALEILQFLANEGTQNYSQIEAKFETSSDVITDRLRQLTNMGFIYREEKNTRDVRYSITSDGKQLIELLEEFQQLLD